MLKQFAEKYLWACSILKVGLFAIGVSKGGLSKIIQGSSAKAAATIHVHVNRNAREIPCGGAGGYSSRISTTLSPSSEGCTVAKGYFEGAGSISASLPLPTAWFWA